MSKENKPGQSRYTIRVLEKALDLLEVLSQHSPLSLTTLCRELGQPKSSVFRYLATLEARGYVRRSADGEEYRLGTKLIELGNLAASQFSVREEAISLMYHLQDRFRETVNLAYLEEGQVVYLEIVEGTQSIRMAARPGRRDFAHSTAIGKAMLAYCADSDVQAALNRHGLPALTAHTITTTGELRAELARVRQRGYAIDDAENEEGVRCVGAPIFDHHGKAVAAISVSGPAGRMTASQTEDIAEALVIATRSISARLGYRGPASNAEG